ncbi:MAG TPA: hypothetical protein VH277_17120 [Gemmatimonadaceae bacterium]|jgi:hypothetical protein|nr:hypothetical protein [Gemmatimonadaceae bacterium]
MRRAAPAFRVLLLLAALLSPSIGRAQAAQSLHDKISQLFIFGSGIDPLFLAGTADPSNPASIRAHGDHFVPSAVSANGSLISFLTGAIATSVGNLPIGTTSGGTTFRFEGGVPVKTSTSAGPIFAERAQTLGQGRSIVGIGRNAFHFTSLRGVPLDNIQLIFTHQNVTEATFPGCDSIQGGDCSKMGIPNLENDIMQFQLKLDLDVTVTNLYATYGITDQLDLGLVVPIVSTRLNGSSFAQIIPFGGPTAAHFFAGTPSNPVLSATRDVNGSALGLGDVAVRSKLKIHESERSRVALVGEARFATGSSDDLLGAGVFSARGLAVVSGVVGDFSPHVNLGYAYHARSTAAPWNDAVLATGGFDDLIAPRVTLAVDLVSELQVGRSNLRLPGPVTYDAPFHRVIEPTTIPDQRDDLINGSFGFKFSLPGSFLVVTNALIPINRGGIRANVIYTTSLELNF